MIEYTLIISLVATFVLLLLKKIGFVEWLQVHGNEFVSKLANCDFCLSWWTCLITACILAAITQNILLILTAILATPITRKLQ